MEESFSAQSPSEVPFSSVTQINLMEEIYSVQSPSEVAFSSVTQIPSGSLKRDRATLSLDEKGTETLICNCCQNVIHVGGEEEEIPLQKAQTVEFCKDNPIGALAAINEDDLSPENKILLGTAKEALIQLSNHRETREGYTEMLRIVKELLIQLAKAREAREGDKNILLRTVPQKQS